jgi:hypothetical protein
MEMRRPFTQNIEEFKSAADANLQKLHKLLDSVNQPSSGEPPRSSGGGSTTSDIRGNSVLRDLDSLEESPESGSKDSADPNEFKHELRVMADVVTYFDIAWKRTFDVVPMFVAEFFIRFSDKLRNTLTQELGLYGKDGDDTCSKYAAEDPDKASQRAKIREELKVLAEATEILNQL